MSLTDSMVTDVTIFQFNPVTLQRFNASTHPMPVVLIEKQAPQITVLTLNRPERRNALTIELMTDLAAAIENAAADPVTRIAILRGAGKAFCTGLDLQEAAVKDPHDTAEAAAHFFLVLAETGRVTIAICSGAISNSKRLLEELWSTSMKQDLERALRHHMEARESPEAKEGVAAYNEKRPPNWVGGTGSVPSN